MVQNLPANARASGDAIQSLGQEDSFTLSDEEMPMDGDLTARTCWSNSNNNDEGNSWLCESSQDWSSHLTQGR